MTKQCRIISLIMVMAVIFTMPGMVFAVSATLKKDNIKDGAIWEPDPDGLLPSVDDYIIAGDGAIYPEADRKQLLLDACRRALKSGNITAHTGVISGKLRKAISKATAAASVQGAQDGTLPNMYSDMSKYIKTVTAPYILGNSNAGVNLPNGALSISYPLVGMSGGMGLSLDIEYDSSDSNTDTVHWNESAIVRYYIVLQDIIEYTSSGGESGIDYHEPFIMWYSSYEPYIEDLQFFSSPVPVNFTEGDYTCTCVTVAVGDGSTRVPITSIVGRAENATRNGLGDGWKFSIPNIETFEYYEFSTELYDRSHRIIKLDTGETFNLVGTSIRDRKLNDITLESASIAVNSSTATLLLTRKDGTKYYFDADGLCLKKEDRFGNAVYYTYSSSGESARLTEMRDSFGRKIIIDYSYDSSSVTVTASDGTRVVISVDGENQDYIKLSSIDYGAGEVYSFSYSHLYGKANIVNDYETFEGEIGYVLLENITHPSGDGTVIGYTSESTNFGGTGTKEYYFVKSTKDVIGGADKNSVSYGRTGNSYDASYHDSLSEYYRQQYEIGNYSFQVRVTTEAGTAVFAFNEKCLCTYYSSGYMVEEKQYNDYNLVSKKTVKDYGSATDSKALCVISSETYGYDIKGNMTSYTAPDGNTTSCTYDSRYSLLTSKTYKQNAGVTVTETHTLSDDGKNIIRDTVSSGGTVAGRTDYTYDALGNVISKTEYQSLSPEKTSVTVYSYEDNVTRGAGIDLDGLFCTSVSVLGIVNADGVATGTVMETFAYDVAGREIRSTDARGNTKTTAYDARGRAISVSYPDGSAETYSYSATGNTVTTTGKSGYTLVSFYDISGRLIRVSEGDTVIETNEYDGAGRLVSKTNCTSSAYYSNIVYTYDARGRILSKTVKNSAGKAVSVTNYAYIVVSIDDTPLCKTQKTVVGDAYSPSVVTTEYTDKSGRTVRAGKMNGGTEIYKTYRYDFAGNPISETAENGGVTTRTYDVFGQVLTVIDALGNSDTNTYSSVGLLLSHSDAMGNRTLYTYDTLGRLLTEKTLFEGTDFALKKYYYDACGNVTGVKIYDGAVGAGASTYKYTETSYDAIGRVTTVLTKSGSDVLSTVSYTYDLAGNVLTEATNGMTVTNTYNIRGELISTRDALGGTESYTYDKNGYMLTKTDRSGTLFTYAYNALGKVTSETATKAGKTTQRRAYSYSSTGAVISESGGGITVSRRYDSLGRLIEEKETDGTDTTVNNYSYDVSGNRTEHKLTLSGEVRSWKSYTYDLLGRMKTVGERPILTEKYDYSYKIMTFGMGGYEEYARYSLSYVGDCGEYCCEFDTMEAFYWHDHENSAWYEISLNPEEPLRGEMYISSSGKMTGIISYQDGSMSCRAEEISDLSEIDPYMGTIYYVIDGTNNIRYTVFAQNNCYYLYPGGDCGFSIPTYIAGGEAEIVAEYTYDARGNILTETKENGITTYYTYNAAGLPKTVINKRGETVISGYTYAYMLDGNIKSITETSGKTVNYTYDGLGRLVKEEKLDNGTTGMISYTYDVNGNRTGKNENGVATTYTYDANNRLISENCGGWLTTYSYDANGNRTGIFVNNNFAGTYSYDLFGKQTSYTANNIGYTYYTYRPDGLRHSVGSTKHIWDGSNIVAEKYGNSETYYTYGIGLIKSGEEYYVFNWHGDVIALTNLTGAITKTYEYDAFGVEDDIDENDPNPWRYCGEYYDKETKTLYLRARYYDIGTGSFTQEDPIKDGSNWYGYCMGSPVALTDPSGLRVVLQENYKTCGRKTSFELFLERVSEKSKPEKKPLEFTRYSYLSSDISMFCNNAKNSCDFNFEYKYSYEKPSVLEEGAKVAATGAVATVAYTVASPVVSFAAGAILIGGLLFSPSKEEHYARNENQPITSLPQTTEEADKLKWTKLPQNKSACHQFTAKDGANTKWVSPDGKMEAVYDSSGKLVLAPEDIGTYNKCPYVSDQGFFMALKTGAGHFLKDMLPWYLWGNSPDDQTTVFDRITGSVGWR
ncbi:MAG: hypothetical protein PUJ72_03465 [Eubacteriales bacterium]|nr:hypothetical protein [Eubacteriales bacterium]